MAEEGTLGIARAEKARAENASEQDLSKEDLQRRMEEKRESISQTVAEMKDAVVQQYESVKETISETLDWREQFRKRPVAWSAGAAGAGFLTGYCVIAMFKGDDQNSYSKGYERARQDYETTYQAAASKSYAAAAPAAQSASEDSGPGLMERIQDTQAFDRLKNEAADIGGHLVHEVSTMTKQVVIPAVVGFLRQWLEEVLPKKSGSAQRTLPPSNAASSQSRYQPVAERQPSQGQV